MKKATTVTLRIEDNLRERIEAIIKAHPAMNISGLMRQMILDSLPAYEAKYLTAQSHPTREARRAAA